MPFYKFPDSGGGFPAGAGVHLHNKFDPTADTLPAGGSRVLKKVLTPQVGGLHIIGQTQWAQVTDDIQLELAVDGALLYEAETDFPKFTRDQGIHDAISQHIVGVAVVAPFLPHTVTLTARNLSGSNAATVEHMSLTIIPGVVDQYDFVPPIPPPPIG